MKYIWSVHICIARNSLCSFQHVFVIGLSYRLEDETDRGRKNPMLKQEARKNAETVLSPKKCLPVKLSLLLLGQIPMLWLHTRLHVMTISSFISKITTVFKQQLIAMLKLACIIT